jgi:hypothetical protein
VEIVGEYLFKDNVDGVIDQNSGGNSIFFLPGLRFNIRTEISCYLGVNIPLVQSYYGLQSKSDYVLTSGIDLNF